MKNAPSKIYGLISDALWEVDQHLFMEIDRPEFVDLRVALIKALDSEVELRNAVALEDSSDY